jgi:hypothetical protein
MLAAPSSSFRPASFRVWVLRIRSFPDKCLLLPERHRRLLVPVSMKPSLCPRTEDPPRRDTSNQGEPRVFGLRTTAAGGALAGTLDPRLCLGKPRIDMGGVLRRAAVQPIPASPRGRNADGRVARKRGTASHMTRALLVIDCEGDDFSRSSAERKRWLRDANLSGSAQGGYLRNASI